MQICWLWKQLENFCYAEMENCLIIPIFFHFSNLMSAENFILVKNVIKADCNN